MKLRFLNIYKAQIKAYLLNIQNQLSQKNVKFDFKILDENPIDEYFDVEVSNKKIYNFLTASADLIRLAMNTLCI